MANGKKLRDLEFKMPDNDLKIGVGTAQDFDFSRENAATLNLGFDSAVREPAKKFRNRKRKIELRDPIAAGQERIKRVHFEGKLRQNGRRKPKRDPLKRGGKFIRQGIRKGARRG